MGAVLLGVGVPVTAIPAGYLIYRSIQALEQPSDPSAAYYSAIAQCAYEYPVNTPDSVIFDCAKERTSHPDNSSEMLALKVTAIGAIVTGTGLVLDPKHNVWRALDDQLTTHHTEDQQLTPVSQAPRLYTAVEDPISGDMVLPSDYHPWKNY